MSDDNSTLAAREYLPRCWPSHRRTLIVAALTLVAICGANFVAFFAPQPTMQDGKYGPHFEIEREYAHGWPLAYVRRHLFRDSHYWLTGNFEEYSAWQPWEGIRAFSPVGLAIDFIVALMCLVCVCTGMERWFSRRGRWQFTIQQALGCTAIIALLLAWIGNARLEYLREERIVSQLYQRLGDPNREQYSVHERACSSPAILPQTQRQELDRRFGQVVDFSGNPEIACQFRHLLTYRTGGPAKNALADCLRKIPQLVGLELDFSHFHAEDDGIANIGLADLPPLRRLRGVNFFSTGVNDEDLRWLAKCTHLETIYLMGEDHISDEGVKHLCHLPRLRRLAIVDSPISDASCRAIAAIENLEGLHLESNRITDDGLSSLTQLKKLKNLWLHTSASDAAITRLKEEMPWCEVISYVVIPATPSVLE